MKFDKKKSRYEIKYVIERARSEVEQLIKIHPKLFREVFSERSVNNLYLDTLSLGSYNDNIIGLPQRLKVRIRWYGKLKGRVNPILEIKLRNNELRDKVSYPLVPFLFNERFSLKKLREVFLESNLPEDVLEMLKDLEFSLINRYKRKYYLSANGNYRMTLDSDVEFFDVSNLGNSLRGKVNPDVIILELKYFRKFHREAHKVTNEFPFRVTKSSKYVSGIELL